MKRLSAPLCGLSLCSLLFCVVLLLLPLQPVGATAAAQNAMPSEELLFSLPIQELDRILFRKKNQEFCLINLGDRFALEGYEELSLNTDKLTALLEHFPLSSIKKNIPSSPDIEIEIISTQDKLTLSLQDCEQGIILSDGAQSYLYPAGSLEPLLTDAEDLIDTTISSIELPPRAALKLSGALHHNTLSLSYYIEEQEYHAFCDEEEISPDLMLPLFHSLCCLTAEQVELLSPSAEDLEAVGFDSPFLIVDAQLAGEDFSLLFSPPQEDGSVYFIKEGTPLLFSASADQLPILSATQETLLEESLFRSHYKNTTAVALSSENFSCRFTKWDGQVLCQGKSVGEKEFYDFYRLCTTLIPKQALLSEPKSTKLLLKLDFSYTNPQQSSDCIEFYSYNEEFCMLSINGQRKFLLEQSIVEEILSACQDFF